MISTARQPGRTSERCDVSVSTELVKASPASVPVFVAPVALPIAIPVVAEHQGQMQV
jgi:hypothetical protein